MKTTSARSVVEARISLLRSRQEQLAQDFDRIKESMRTVHAQIHVLQSVLAEFPDDAIDESSEEGEGEGEPEKQGATDAVLDLLKNHPDGLLIREVVNTLKDTVETNAADPRRMLYNTILNLRKRRTIQAYDTPEGIRVAILNGQSD